MMDFFTDKPSVAPQLGWLWQSVLLLILVACLCATYVYHEKTWFRRAFWGLQLAQVLSLYSWYAIKGLPLSESLPFYHCRLAMLVLLFAKPGLLKTYFSYLGLFGSIAAFVYPVFDPYPFPHLTFFSFVIGHYALAVNSFSSILEHIQAEKRALRIRQITILTLLQNGLFSLVNGFTGGNYGFLQQTPLVNSTHSVLNFYLVTLVVVVAIFFLQEGMCFLAKRYQWI